MKWRRRPLRLTRSQDWSFRAVAKAAVGMPRNAIWSSPFEDRDTPSRLTHSHEARTQSLSLNKDWPAIAG